MTTTPLVVVGLMSGTSVDALDAAVTEIWDEGDALALRLLAYRETAYDPGLRERVHRLFEPAGSATADVCEVNVLLAEAFAGAALAALEDTGVRADLVASHGQTVWHEVAAGRTRSTLQLGDPSTMAERLGTTVAADFRPRDIAAGGQGAPLSSWPDALLFGDLAQSRAVQNIGGIGNVTWVPAGGRWDEMLAFDTGPGNTLIDTAATMLSGGTQRFDRDGAMAARGTVDETLLADLLAHPYFAAPPPKSTGREQFGAPFAATIVERGTRRGLRETDILATLTAFTAQSIADQYRRFLPFAPDEVVVGGGGTRNGTLMRKLDEQVRPARLRLHEDFGLPSTGREAVYFALLGYETLHGRPNSVPACTGARHRSVLGTLTPGPNYRTLLEQVLASSSRPSQRLRLVRG